MARRGFAALRFDFTPLGTLSSQVGELRAVVDFCRHNLGRRIVLFGRSMGGSASLAVAAADPLIVGLCLWSTPHDLHETFRLSLGEAYARLADGETLNLADEFGYLRLSPDFLSDFDRFDLLADAGRLAKRPLLVVHGEEDEIVPLRQAGEIIDRAAAPKKLHVIPGGDHRFLIGYHQASGAVLSWLSEAFPPLAGPNCI
jgi:putative redox protein